MYRDLQKAPKNPFLVEFLFCDALGRSAQGIQATAGQPGTYIYPPYVTGTQRSHPCGTSGSIQGEQPLDSNKAPHHQQPKDSSSDTPPQR